MIPGTLGTLFSCGGGFEVGAEAAGLKSIWAVELESDLAAVHVRNLPGCQMLTADVCDVDYATLPRPEWLHASPPCTSASSANVDAGETELDRTLSRAVCRAITALRPVVFSLENVWFYRTFDSFALILAELCRQGYEVAWWHLNAADFGIPQTRKRLILVARLDGTPVHPRPTHQDPSRIAEPTGQLSMLALALPLPAWNGWFSAVMDIIHTFEPTEPAHWQEERLPEELRTLLVHPTDMRTMPTRSIDEPSFTVMSGSGGNSWAPLPLIIKGTDAGSNGRGYREADEPMFVGTSGMEKGQPRALIMDGQKSNGTVGLTIRAGSEPVFVVTASHGKRPLRAMVAGRWVKIPVRGLADFQSVPRWYWLPSSPVLACRVVGNMVPPRLAELVVRAQRLSLNI